MKFVNEIIDINICDIGAGESEDVPFLKNIVNNCNTHITGFEPNLDQFNKLISTEKKNILTLQLEMEQKRNLMFARHLG